ncbi:hypothetical protein CL658_04330 [bacterium]|nr:hypothetical protein [bacterium]
MENDMDDIKKDSNNQEKPSFFSMRSPTLDALSATVKSWIDSAKAKKEDGDDLDAMFTKPSSKKQSNPSKTDAVIASNNRADKGASRSIEMEEIDVSETPSKQDVSKETVSDDSVKDHDGFDANQDDVIEDVSEKKDAIQSDTEASLSSETSVQGAMNPAEEDFNKEESVSSDSLGDSSDLEDTNTDDIIEESSDSADIDMNVDDDSVSDSRVISNTIFKPNSVLGNLDDQVLKSFSRKSLTKKEDPLL